MYKDTKIVKISDTEYKAVEGDGSWKKIKRAFSFDIKFSNFTILDTCLVQDLKATNTDDGLDVMKYDGSNISSELFATGSVLKDLSVYSHYPFDEENGILTLSELFNSKNILECSFFELDYNVHKKGHLAYLQYNGIRISLPKKTINYIIKLIRNNNKIEVTINFLFHQQYHEQGAFWHVYIPDDCNYIYLQDVRIRTIQETSSEKKTQDEIEKHKYYIQDNFYKDSKAINVKLQLNYQRMFYAVLISFTIIIISIYIKK
jgi:hypothetical protein